MCVINQWVRWSGPVRILVTSQHGTPWSSLGTLVHDVMHNSNVDVAQLSHARSAAENASENVCPQAYSIGEFVGKSN